MNNKLPQVPSNTGDKYTQLKENDIKAKSKMKEKADRGRKTDDIQVKDTVLVKQKKRNKFTSRFDPVPFQVVKKRDNGYCSKKRKVHHKKCISF